MIKRVLSIIMIATLLFSCNDTEYNNEGISSSESNAINFSVLQVEASRAVETTTSTLCQDGNKIAVTAIQHLGKSYGSNLSQPLVIMDNVRVTYSGGVWSYSPKAYWPIYADEYATFYSYYPISDNGYNGLTKSVSVSNNGTMSFYLERVADKSIDQDVIYAIESDKTAASSGGTIFFNFRHLLSKLNFKIALNSDDDNRSIRVTSIGLQNYKSCATYQNHYGMIEMVNGSANIDTENLLLLAKTSFEVENGQEVNLESQLMLPQFIDASSCADKSPKIVLEYVVIEADGSETPKSVSYSLENGFDAWNSGYSYNYTLKIDNSAISVDGSVGDFEEGGDAELNGPEPKPDPKPVKPVYEMECPNGPGYVNVAGQYNVAELIAGCNPDMEPQFGYENEEGEMVWQDWSVTDGWFGPDGPMNWGADCILCIKPNSDGSFNHISSYPGAEPAEVVVYINYGNDVILEIIVEITPEEVKETNEYTIVETITVERTVTFVPGHGIVPESYTLDMAAITEKIGGTPNEFLMSRPDGKFQDWSTTDGWFGEEGAVAWGSGSALKCLKPQADGTFADDCCHPDAEASLPIVANCTYRYGNTETMKAVDVKFAVTIQAEAEVVLPDFAITPEAGVVEVAADGATTYEAQIIAKDGYTLVKYIYDAQYGMTNIFSEYQECWYTIEEGENGKVEVTFEANAKPEARKAYLYAMPTSAYEALNGDVDGFFVADVNAYVWEMSEQAAQYLIAEFLQEAGEVDDTFEFDPMGKVVEVAADASTYFTATINCPAGYTLVKYNYTEWGMTNIYSEYQDFWCWVNDDNEGNIEVNFEINETGSPRKAYLYVMPTSVYETLGGDIDGFFTDQSNPDLWEPSEQAAQYLIAEFQQEAGCAE